MSNHTPKARVLVAEDEASLRNLLDLSLTAQHYEVIHAVDGRDALAQLKAHPDIDMIILDIMMPHLDGFSVLQEVRKTSDIPVVILTALGSGDDIIKGFNLGADDYITKPFTFREVSARIDAILRRMQWLRQPPPSPPTLYRAGQVALDIVAHQIRVHNQPCHVTPIEFNLLLYFMSHPDQIISKDELFREVWGYEFEGSTNLVEVAVRRLREKIEQNPSEPELIRTVRGIGYRFTQPPESS